MPGRTIAIGDIHGCHVALDALIEAIAPRSDDTLVVLGDMIDRGPGSAEVIERLVELVGRCRLIPLMGNHERMMLDAATRPSTTRFWLQNGGQATLASYGGSLSSVPHHHRTFFRYLQLTFETPTHLFVHACYDPYSEPGDFDEDIALWRHVDREIPEPHQSGKIAVVGHTPQADGLPRDHGHIRLLDTFCYGGRALTAWDVATDEVLQADNRGNVSTAPFVRE